MRLPFLWLALGFSSGIVAEKCWDISIVWPVCGLGTGIVLLRSLRTQKIFLPIFVFALACAGILWARLDAHVPANAIQNFAGPGRATLRGVVNSLPEIKTQGKKMTVSFVLGVRSITKEESGRRKFFKASGNVQTFLLQSSEVPQVGDELRLYGELSVPRTVLNPGEFDYGKFLAQKNVRAIFQTIGKRCVRMTKTGKPWSLPRIVAEARRYLAALIDRLYTAPEVAIVKALSLGLRGDVSSEIRSQFMRTGTIHLFATANTKRDFAPFSNKIIAAYSP